MSNFAYSDKTSLHCDEVNDGNFHSIDLKDYSLDELCRIHQRLLTLISDHFHNGGNERSGYITLMCDKVMAEIKNQLIYMAI